MLAIVAGVIGLIWGARVASKRGGNRADMFQYSLGYGVTFLFATWLIIIIVASIFA